MLNYDEAADVSFDLLDPYWDRPWASLTTLLDTCVYRLVHDLSRLG